MIRLLFRNKPLLFFLLFVGIFAVLFLLLGVYLLLPSNPSPISQQPSEKHFSQQTAKYPTVTEITPAEYMLLVPGKKQTFTIHFQNLVDVTGLKATLIHSVIASPQTTTPVPLMTTYDNQHHILSITTRSLIKPVSKYLLTVSDPNSNAILLLINYHSSNVPLTPVPSNNPSLQPYLPHETANYVLSYNKERNVYIFSFKIDPGSRLGLSQQYAAAKADATRFIQGKGIPLITIVIEWKNH